jgi:hypothetical protein
MVSAAEPYVRILGSLDRSSYCSFALTRLSRPRSRPSTYQTNRVEPGIETGPLVLTTRRQRRSEVVGEISSLLRDSGRLCSIDPQYLFKFIGAI